MKKARKIHGSSLSTPCPTVNPFCSVHTSWTTPQRAKGNQDLQLPTLQTQRIPHTSTPATRPGEQRDLSPCSQSRWQRLPSLPGVPRGRHREEQLRARCCGAALGHGAGGMLSLQPLRAPPLPESPPREICCSGSGSARARGVPPVQKTSVPSSEPLPSVQLRGMQREGQVLANHGLARIFISAENSFMAGCSPRLVLMGAIKHDAPEWGTAHLALPVRCRSRNKEPVNSSC